MTSRPRVLVVQHEDVCPVGMVGVWLERAGVGCDVLEAQHGRALPAALGEHVGLVVMGGRMAATDDADHRWLVPTRALIVGTVCAGLPFLGICLGHQLAAVALGGEVTPNPHGPTVGLQPWCPTPEGRQDQLVGALTPDTPVLHHNHDVAVRLPRTAVPLATAPDGSVQAARFGPRAWGVQFHPEVTTSTVQGWVTGPDDAAGLGAARQVGDRQAELHRAWEPLARRFARIALEG